MDLLLRVSGDQLTAPRDVVVASDDRHTVADLCAALADHLGIDVPALVPAWAARGLEQTMPIVACGLASGDEIVVGDRVESGGRLRSATRAIVDVVAGPDAGRSGPIGASAMVGRSANADFVLRDPMVSRLHVELLIEPARVVVRPVDPIASVVAVNGVQISDVTPIEDGDVIAIGNTHLTLRRDVDCAGRRPADRGEVSFRRPPRRLPVVTEGETILIGPIPEERDPRRFQVLTLAAPLAAGLLMFAFSRQIQFLALMLLSPVVLVATTIDDRRAGRRGRRRELAAFRAMLADRAHEAAERRARERIERLGAAPDLAELAQRAGRVASDLWQRRPGDHDFLRVRVGVGAAVARFDVAIEPGGSNALRAEAEAAIAGWTAIERVPVCVGLAGNTLAIHGDRARVEALAAAVLVQVACLHSPEEVVIAAAVRPGRSFAWLKWLPHVGRAAESTGCDLAWTPDETTDLIGRLSDLDSRGPDGPRVIVLVDGAIVRPADAARLRELAQRPNVGVVWLADDATTVPPQATHVIDVGRAHVGTSSSRLWSAGDASQGSDFDHEALSPAVAERVAMSLAPVRDIGWSAGSAVPDSVTLFGALGRVPSAATVARAWRSSRAVRLDGALGVGSDGPVVIDLIADGPHMLVAGTTGSGKSELLQSIVATFAARHPPSRLNFLFVDYKGGATSSAFDRLPHNVGAVTNLDVASARRAIVSLRAELDRRMTLFDGRARDLAEMLTRFPDLAPPALVIVIDEFATISKELPEFVTGVVDIAQRGRSLGVHLVLSTQRAAGSVDERILANMNLRVSLRVIDRADSTSVVGTAGAAEIPVTRRGRGLARIGSRALLAFQGAYGGGPAFDRSERRPLAVTDFARPGSRAEHPGVHQTHHVIAASQLAAVVDAVVAAHTTLGSPAPRRPWCDPLPSLVTLDSLGAETVERGRGERGRFLTIARFDAPERQAQGALTIDLEGGGGCVIFGSGGSGKTTALRTIALELSTTSRGGDLALLAFDCASGGLTTLSELPDVIDVATGEDIEAMTRHIVMLDAELARRRQVLSAASAEDLSAYNARNAPMPRIVVLIDGFSGLAEILSGRAGGLSFGGESWLDRIVRILVDGRQVGIHAVLTSDRRNAVPARLLGAISNRIVLNHADPVAYAEHGIAIADATCGELPPGRGWWNATTPVQLAVASADHTASAQSQVIGRAAALIARRRPEVLCSSPLPTRVVTEPIAVRRHPHVAPIGIEDVTGAIVTLDLTRSHAAIVGGPRSGRSTALAALAHTFSADHEVLAVGPVGCGLASLRGEDSAFGAPDVIVPQLERFAVETGGRRSRPAVLIVDDLDVLDPSLAPCWGRLVAAPHVRIVAATRTEAMIGYVADPLAAALRRSRQVLALAPDDPGEFLQLTGVKLDVRPGVQWVPGRGVLVIDRQPHVVQVAVPSEVQADWANVRTHVRSRASLAA